MDDIFSNNTTVCVPYVKPVKYITFLCHSIANYIVASHANVLRGSAGTRDEPLRTSAWEANCKHEQRRILCTLFFGGDFK